MQSQYFRKEVKTSDETAPRRVAVLGATGSIGGSALDVIAASGGRLTAAVLTSHRQTVKLAELARRFHPEILVVTDSEADRAPLADADSLRTGRTRRGGFCPRNRRRPGGDCRRCGSARLMARSGGGEDARPGE